MRTAAALSAALALGGCAVTSETPLFKPGDAAPHQLAQGAWALHGPGCDVAAGQPTPDCALPFLVQGDRLMMDPAGAASAMSKLGPMAESANDTGGPNEFLLVEGDPEVLQLRDLAKSASGAETAGHRSYMAFKPLHRNAEGKTDKGIMWFITCPKAVGGTPGIKTNGQGCEAVTPKAVLAQAKQVPPFLSFFMTWLGPAPAEKAATPPKG
jgi:hypothetical protein